MPHRPDTYSTNNGSSSSSSSAVYHPSAYHQGQAPSRQQQQEHLNSRVPPLTPAAVYGGTPAPQTGMYPMTATPHDVHDDDDDDDKEPQQTMLWRHRSDHKREVQRTPDPDRQHYQQQQQQQQQQQPRGLLDTAEKAAASALLLAAGTAVERQPPKKRKKHLDVLRRNRVIDDNPCHQVSPVSSGSVSSQPDSTKNLHKSHHHHTAAAATTPTSPDDDDRLRPVLSTATSTTTASTATPTSFEYNKDKAQALTESAKIGDAAEIGSPVAPSAAAASATVVVVTDFPSVLHQVLSHSRVASSVLQWLPHGQAWRVVRWDALRRHVLPAHFPQLCNNNNSNNQKDDGGQQQQGSIDGFLWNVRAWGFDEIKDGPDVGAYRNNLFLRGAPTLCKQMELKPVHDNNSKTPGDSTTGSTSMSSDQDSRHHHQQHRSPPPHTLLRVPSLATSQSDGDAKAVVHTPETHPWYGRSSSKGTEDDRRQQQQQQQQQQHSGGSSPYGAWRVPVYDHMMPQYHSAADERYSRHPHHHPHHHYPYHPPHPASSPVRTSVPPPYDARYPFRPHPDNVMRRGGGEHHHHTPSPPVRSGRGGSRMVRSEPPRNRLTDEKPSKKRSFPVSQRGRGRGQQPRLVVSSHHHNNNNNKTTEDEDDHDMVDETTRPSLSARVAVAISRKTKRKLPLSRSASVTPVEGDTAPPPQQPN